MYPVFYALTRAIKHRNGEHNNARAESAVIFHCVFYLSKKNALRNTEIYLACQTENHNLPEFFSMR